MSHHQLCSAPRLSNGSEWLFHGKDEVRGVLGALGGQQDVGVAKGTKNGVARGH